jgi:hypothetical protein
MNKVNFSFVFTIILGISFSLFLFENSFAQENLIIPPRHQWKQSPTPDTLTCKEGLILLQKINGTPACVSSSTYLKLIDRGYGKFDSSQLIKRPKMMTHLMGGMIVEPQLMRHWHMMMVNDSKIMQHTMSDMVLQLKGNPEFLANIMGPMTTNLELREQMIEHMENHDQMMISFQEHRGWMNSVHQPMIDSNMDQGMGSGMHGKDKCSWCPEIEQHNLHANLGFHQPKIMEDMMHHIWVNEKMRSQMHDFMLENPPHMDLMTGEIMDSMLGLMMDDPELRQQMIDMMLEHSEFMNSIRHENKFSN